MNDEPHVPFGGMKNSGLGRHGGKASIETFTELRWLTLERGGRHYPPPFVVQMSVRTIETARIDRGRAILARPIGDDKNEQNDH